jgi:hypothetical protein
MCRLSRNPGALNSRTPQGHVGLFWGYFTFYIFTLQEQCVCCGPFHLAHNSDQWSVCAKNVMKHSVQCSDGKFLLVSYLRLVAQLLRNVRIKKLWHEISYIDHRVSSFRAISRFIKRKREKSLFFYVRIPNDYQSGFICVYQQFYVTHKNVPPTCFF